MEKSIRELISDFQNEIMAGDLLPERAAEILTQISALLGNINDRIKDCDIAYSKVLLKHLETQEKANRAKIVAETTQEYDDKITARNTRELAIEMLRSLKYFLRGKEEEIRAGRFMQ